jgi:flavorubredoxin
MKAVSLYQGSHEWIVFGRDPSKPDKIIDTNQYLIKTQHRCLILDPGGMELFAPMLAAVLKYIPIDQITDLFASHQDPDVISSLGLWDQVLPQARLHAPWLWEGFLRHFGMNHIEYAAIPDEGSVLDLGGTLLEFIPAHYLHSSGNFHVFDPQSGILFTGDIGAALEPADAGMFVEDFDSHTRFMKLFHQRWMPSNAAKNDWIKRVRALKPRILAPQHGRLFRDGDVLRFLDWLEALDVGIAIRNNSE